MDAHRSGRALRWEHAAVQHYPVGFREIVASFLDHLQISMDTVKLDYDPSAEKANRQCRQRAVKSGIPAMGV